MKIAVFSSPVWDYLVMGFQMDFLLFQLRKMRGGLGHTGTEPQELFCLPSLSLPILQFDSQTNTFAAHLDEQAGRQTA